MLVLKNLPQVKETKIKFSVTGLTKITFKVSLMCTHQADTQTLACCSYVG